MYFFAVILEPPCYDGQTRLSNGGYGYLNDDRSFSIGRPEICTDNEYLPVCGGIGNTEAISFCGNTAGLYGMYTCTCIDVFIIYRW